MLPAGPFANYSRAVCSSTSDTVVFISSGSVLARVPSFLKQIPLQSTTVNKNKGTLVFVKEAYS